MTVRPAVDQQWDHVIIGSGVAGLRAAIEAARHGRVVVLSKDAWRDSSSDLAQGGVAVALSDEDRLGLHQDDTLAAGAGLCNEEAVRTLVREGPAYILEMIDWGAAFDREGGRLSFTREAAHSQRRVLHASGDSTGREMVRVLHAKAASLAGVELLDHLFSIDLIVQDGRCVGVWVLDTATGETRAILGRTFMLATGGCGRLYRATSNPPFATGDGVAIAATAGARLQDMEFFQFHPTTLNLPGAPNFLLTEAIRGEGGALRNADGERFMTRYHPAAELAPRDVVARAIMSEVRRQGREGISLDLTELGREFVHRRFPGICRTLAGYGLDPADRPVPVLPAAHYCMGGVATDLWGRTSLPGLFAAGEAACTGVHGANRLASNSLLEGLVFGGRCGERMALEAEGPGPGELPPPPAVRPPRDAEWVQRRRRELTDVMWRRVGIERCGQTLAEAVGWLDGLWGEVSTPAADRAWMELRNLAVVGLAVARFALNREESRGGHFRTDYPDRDDDRWCRHQVLTMDGW